MPEYWSIDPDHQNVLVYVLKGDNYQNPINVVDDYSPSAKFPALRLHTDDIF